MDIVRHRYLEHLKVRMNNGLIKVITGIRRSGKSHLLFNQFKKYLLESGVPQKNIISAALDDDVFKKLRDPQELSSFVRAKVKSTKQRYYVLLDEIQMAISAEELANPLMSKEIYSVLNGFLHLENVDVYVTGSNSRFLSKDVLTEFRGRGDEVHVLPFVFSEFMQGYSGDAYHGWADYMTFGGLPLILSFRTDEQKVRYLKNLFEETYLKDIVSRNGIAKTQELENLIDILASSVSSLTNASKICQTFKSVYHSEIGLNTVKKYMDCLDDAFMTSSAKRFDVKGRKYIVTPLKYYFEDIGLRNARLNFRQNEENHIMENVIYNELRYRGYNVDVGVVEKNIKIDGKSKRVSYEIDFVATLGSAKYYIQSAFNVSNYEKSEQEKNSLINVSDSFKKIVVVKDVVKPNYDEHGILTIGLFDFLLGDIV